MTEILAIRVCARLLQKLCKLPKRCKIERIFRGIFNAKVQINPGERTAKAAKKEKLRELMSETQVEDINDINTLFNEMVRDILKNGLEAYLDEDLSYSKYDYMNKDTSNSRNEYSTKTMKPNFGDVK